MSYHLPYYMVPSTLHLLSGGLPEQPEDYMSMSSTLAERLQATLDGVENPQATEILNFGNMDSVAEQMFQEFIEPSSFNESLTSPDLLTEGHSTDIGAPPQMYTITTTEHHPYLPTSLADASLGSVATSATIPPSLLASLDDATHTSGAFYLDHLDRTADSFLQATHTQDARSDTLATFLTVAAIDTGGLTASPFYIIPPRGTALLQSTFASVEPPSVAATSTVSLCSPYFACLAPPSFMQSAMPYTLYSEMSSQSTSSAGALHYDVAGIVRSGTLSGSASSRRAILLPTSSVPVPSLDPSTSYCMCNDVPPDSERGRVRAKEETDPEDQSVDALNSLVSPSATQSMVTLAEDPMNTVVSEPLEVSQDFVSLPPAVVTKSCRTSTAIHRYTLRSSRKHTQADAETEMDVQGDEIPLSRPASKRRRVTTKAEGIQVARKRGSRQKDSSSASKPSRWPLKSEPATSAIIDSDQLHRLCTTPSGTERPICVCGRRFTRDADARRHVALHGRQTWPCPLCCAARSGAELQGPSSGTCGEGYWLARPDSLLRHCRLAHPEYLAEHGNEGVKKASRYIAAGYGIDI